MMLNIAYAIGRGGSAGQGAGTSSFIPALIFLAFIGWGFARIARKQGKSFWVFFILGMIPFVSIVALFVLGNREKTHCPECGEKVLKVAKKCKHCGYYFDSTIRKGSAENDMSPVDTQSGEEGDTEHLSKPGLSDDDEEFAIKLVALIRQANAEYSTNKDAYEKTRSKIRTIGKHLCENGGSERMKKVAYRVQALGARVRDCEFHWEGICGWMY
jgi:ribosomal protein L37E